jgi:hypothetical protein
VLNRTDILNRKWPMESVTLPEFDGETVNVKTLSAAEFLRLAELEKAHPQKGYALWWISCVCDEQGQPLFTVDDIEAITHLPISPVNRVVEVAKKLNLPQEQAAKHSAPIPSAG